MDGTKDGAERLYEEGGWMDEEREEELEEYEELVAEEAGGVDEEREDALEKHEELVEQGKETVVEAEPQTIDDRMYALARKSGIMWEVIDLTTDKRIKIWTYEFRIRTTFLHSLFSYSRARQIHYDADPERYQRQLDGNSVYYPDDMDYGIDGDRMSE
ncbi:hypothetical protein Vi05172_g173 [Venturia inaequalis]|nr:hypothetical protein Vi05172_g173 [Venturia inaequalis]